MERRYEIRLSGYGGQGLILIGIILAEAVGLYEGKQVVQTQSYGPEARGGASRSELVVSDQEIDYPKPLGLDLLLAMNQQSLNLYCGDVKEGGIVVADSTFCDQFPVSRVVKIPFTRLAREQLGREIVANIMALGAVGAVSGIVGFESLKKAVLNRVPKGTEDLNLKALQMGWKLGEKAKRELVKEGREEYIISAEEL
ncbi:MAG: 2-oxoacid:ferredoxin oxidoreductase subunit gamma [Deltaproteobacteria bacterium]|nr:MAG: 2-oxoacid:ferredoxin oxidoreductase subunit gamma [Deltaproteobacteria bacterium]